jgi:coenzyme PQQ precursor peptide PqqA
MLQCGLLCSARKRESTGLNLRVMLHIVMTKLLANLWPATRLTYLQPLLQQKRETIMAWKAPKIVEVAVGMEINMYACAARK